MGEVSGRRPWNRTQTTTQGNVKEQRSQAYESNLAVVPPPAGIDKRNVQIWHEVLKSAPSNHFAPADLHTLEAYVGMIAQRRSLEKLLVKQKGTEADGMLVKRNGTLHPNPLMTMYRALLRDQASYASLLRLTGRRVRVTDSEAERADRAASSPRSTRAGLLGGSAVDHSDE